METTDIIYKAIITEKMTAQSEKQNCFGFIVDKRANKIQIRKAVEEMYGVSISSVRTMNYAGKKVSRYTKSAVVQGRKKSFKKAIVQVVEGDTIDLYSNI